MSPRGLIVDDNPRFLTSARNLLRRQGFSDVLVASNQADAIAIATAYHLDVALVDVDLGEENGLDVARALASCVKPVPVILISAYDELQIQDVLESSSALGFLPKSIVSRQAIDDLLTGAGESHAH